MVLVPDINRSEVTIQVFGQKAEEKPVPFNK